MTTRVGEPPGHAINVALRLLPQRMDSAQARVMLLAIGWQESAFVRRLQVGGPARGYWQFERGGGVVGVLRHMASALHARDICERRGVLPTASAAYLAIAHDDVLAAAFARLLLWTDPMPLPAIGDQAGGWSLYSRTWRPGKPHPDRWPANYMRASNIVVSDTTG